VSAVLVALALAGVYGPNERVAYVRDALAAIDASDEKTLTDTIGYIDVMDRNECRSVYHRLRAQCLIEVAKRNCRGQRGRKARRACVLYSDIIVTNKLSEGHFVTTADRYLIMHRHRDFRERMRAELRRRYGSLVTDFTLSEHFNCTSNDRDCLAEAVHDYCVEYADTHSLSWQHCAAAVTWFIGTTRVD